MEKTMKIFALSAGKELGVKIADKLGVALGDSEVKHFSDGEIMVEVNESVRGKNAYIIQPTCYPVSDNLMEILILTDALKRASAKEITVMMPYFGYARQDRKAKPRQPITAKLVANLLYTAGVHRVVTVDLHAAQIQGFFDCLNDDMSALSTISYYLKEQHWSKDNVVVVSPDHGGVVRARKLADELHCGLAIIDKRRPRPNVAEIMNIIGDVEGKTCILIDDMIDTGGSIVAGAEALKQKKAKDIYVACTHPVFSGDAVEKLKNSVIKEIVTTDTIPLSDNKMFDKLTILSVDSILAKTIEHIEKNLPVSDVVDMFK